MNIFSKIKKNIAILFLFITSCEYLDLCSIANSDIFNINEKYNVKYVISGHLHQNNESKIRNVMYKTLTTLQNEKNAVLLISINKTEITTTLLDLPED